MELNARDESRPWSVRFQLYVFSLFKAENVSKFLANLSSFSVKACYRSTLPRLKELQLSLLPRNASSCLARSF